MLNNEVKFWSDMLVASNPGWSITVAHQWGEGMPGGLDLRVNVYAFDTASGWSGACATSALDFQAAHDLLRDSDTKRQAVQVAAHKDLKQVADAGASAQEEMTRRALVLDMYYLAQTQTFSTVRAHMGTIEGHWLTLLYRFKSGASTLRPVYRSSVIGAGMLSPSQLARWAAEVVEEDAQREQSAIATHLRRGDELVLPSG